MTPVLGSTPSGQVRPRLGHQWLIVSGAYVPQDAQHHPRLRVTGAEPARQPAEAYVLG